MTVGIGTIAVMRQRVKECQVLGPTGKKRNGDILNFRKKEINVLIIGKVT